MTRPGQLIKWGSVRSFLRGVRATPDLSDHKGGEFAKSTQVLQRCLGFFLLFHSMLKTKGLGTVFCSAYVTEKKLRAKFTIGSWNSNSIPCLTPMSPQQRRNLHSSEQHSQHHLEACASRRGKNHGEILVDYKGGEAGSQHRGSINHCELPAPSIFSFVIPDWYSFFSYSLTST